MTGMALAREKYRPARRYAERGGWHQRFSSAFRLSVSVACPSSAVELSMDDLSRVRRLRCERPLEGLPPPPRPFPAGRRSAGRRIGASPLSTTVCSTASTHNAREDGRTDDVDFVWVVFSLSERDAPARTATVEKDEEEEHEVVVVEEEEDGEEEEEREAADGEREGGGCRGD